MYLLNTTSGATAIIFDASAASSSGAVALVRNSVIVGTVGSNTASSSLVAYLYNDTINVGSNEILNHGATFTFINTLFSSATANNGGFLTYGTGSAVTTCNYCAFATNPPNGGSGDGWYYNSGSNNRNSQTFTFESSPPYQIKSTDTGAKGHGENLSSASPFPFTIDIESNTRTVPWDIGAYIYGP
jgi:hypothetical protein